MRKLFYALVLLVTTLAFSQSKKAPVKKQPIKLTEKQIIEKKAKEYFEKEFVQNNFKDPYSYELKKIWTDEMTQYSVKYDSATVYLFKHLELLKTKEDRGYIGLTINENNQMIKYKMKQEALEKEIEMMPESEKNKVVAYQVNFDTYGANSYGNKILGRYYIRYWKNGERYSDAIKKKDD